MERSSRSEVTGPAGNSAMGYYLRSLREPIMSREEEHDLAVTLRKTGSPALAARLVSANLKLVVKIAFEFRRGQREMLDVIQEGNLGLIYAVHKFDPDRGVKLSSYASWWIRAYILKFMIANKSLVKIGTCAAQRKLFFNLRKEEARLQREGLQVDAGQVAARLGVREREVLEMQQRLGGPEVPLDAPSRAGDSAVTMGDKISAEASTRPDLQVEAELLGRFVKERLEAFGETLCPRDRAIFRARLLNDEPASLAELGEQLGVTRERIRQLEAKVKLRLRRFLAAKFGKDLDYSDLSVDWSRAAMPAQ